MVSLPKPLPKARNLAVKVMRERRGLRQNELMAKAGLSKTAMTRLESGRLEVTTRTLARIGRDLGYAPDSVEWLVFALGVFSDEPELPASAAGLSPQARGQIVKEGARRVRKELEKFLEGLIQEAQEQRHSEERKAAAVLYRGLAPLHVDRQKDLIEERGEYQTWAMVERLCEESRRAASDDPGRALELANLALRCSKSKAVPVTLRARLAGFAWAFIANARRVGSNLPAAEEAFGLAWAAWRRGKRAASLTPLGSWQLYDLEASLRREQLRLRAALSLLSRALKGAPARVIGRLFLNKATIYIVMGQPQKAISVLQEAEESVAEVDDPSLHFALRFNLGVVLEQAGQIEGSQELLPELRQLATGLRSEISLSRVAWLHARILARKSETTGAIAGLERVLRDFSQWKLAHDAAQAALELSVLLLQQGRTDRVKVLAREAVWIFEAQRVQPRVLAALKVFFDAVTRETVSVAIAQDTLREINQARLFGV